MDVADDSSLGPLVVGIIGVTGCFVGVGALAIAIYLYMRRRRRGRESGRAATDTEDTQSLSAMAGAARRGARQDSGRHSGQRTRRSLARTASSSRRSSRSASFRRSQHSQRDLLSEHARAKKKLEHLEQQQQILQQQQQQQHRASYAQPYAFAHAGPQRQNSNYQFAQMQLPQYEARQSRFSAVQSSQSHLQRASDQRASQQWPVPPPVNSRRLPSAPRGVAGARRESQLGGGGAPRRESHTALGRIPSGVNVQSAAAGAVGTYQPMPPGAFQPAREASSTYDVVPPSENVGAIPYDRVPEPESAGDRFRLERERALAAAGGEVQDVRISEI